MSAQAQIADRRFQHYVGARLSVVYSFWSLVLHSMLWVLGLKRTARYKIVPIIVVAIAFLPSLVLIVVAVVAPPGTPLPGYAGFYQFIIAAIYIFVALTAPELICPDRRHGTLRMYMTSNLGPTTYVAAKLVAVWSILGIVTVGPVLVEFLGLSVVGQGPDGLTESLKTLGQVIGSGLVLAVFFGSVALAISSLTDRNAFASAGIILGFILTGAAFGILQGPLNAPDWVALVNVDQLPMELVFRIYQAASTISVPTWEVAAAAVAWVVGAIGVLALRYRSWGRR
ncbi:MAG TPA: ABC transporter permease [Clostridia bacterium]|nr:ABC transporter permease [Clostridia bacterium]